MTHVHNRYGYDITVRELPNGWHELSTIAESMGEEYRQHQLLAHKPTEVDYDKFINVVELCK